MGPSFCFVEDKKKYMLNDHKRIFTVEFKDDGEYTIQVLSKHDDEWVLTDEKVVTLESSKLLSLTKFHHS